MPEEVVDTNKLQETLDSLVKAADATNLIKGGIANSGTYGSDGRQGGGQGTMADAGGLDNMMIAKMAEMGIPVDTIAAFNAFMSAKQTDDDEEQQDMGAAAVGPNSVVTPTDTRAISPSFMGKKSRKSEENGDLQKSVMDDFLSDDGIKDVVDVSNYLDGLTTKVVEHIDGLRKSVDSEQTKQDTINKSMAAAVHQLGTLVKSQANLINAMGDKMGVLERAPVATPKGATTSTQAVLQKAMAGEVGAGNGDEPLTKSQACSVLTYMNLEKGIHDIRGRKTSELVGLLEGGNVYDQDTHGAVSQFLKDNPNEATIAKSYH